MLGFFLVTPELKKVPRRSVSKNLQLKFIAKLSFNFNFNLVESWDIYIYPSQKCKIHLSSTYITTKWYSAHLGPNWSGPIFTISSPLAGFHIPSIAQHCLTEDIFYTGLIHNFHTWMSFPRTTCQNNFLHRLHIFFHGLFLYAVLANSYLLLPHRNHNHHK